MTANLETSAARVDRVFAALSNLGDAELLAMSGVWTGGDADLREEAWTKIRDRMRHDPRAKLLDESRDRLASWVNDLGITWAGAYNRSIIVPAGADQGNLRINAVPALLDAIVAMLFDEVLDDDEREELLAPLRHVTDPNADSDAEGTDKEADLDAAPEPASD